MVIVVDASIIAKLYRDEAESDAAIAFVRQHASAMAAPDLIGVEVAGVLVRDGNAQPERKALQMAKLAHLAEFLDSDAIQLVRSEPHAIWRAGQLASTLGTPIKDCIYLVLARDMNCSLATADARFKAKAGNVADIQLLTA